MSRLAGLEEKQTNEGWFDTSNACFVIFSGNHPTFCFNFLQTGESWKLQLFYDSRFIGLPRGRRVGQVNYVGSATRNLLDFTCKESIFWGEYFFTRSDSRGITCVRLHASLIRVSLFQFYLFCATLSRSEERKPGVHYVTAIRRYGGRAYKYNVCSFRFSSLAIMSEVQILSPKKAALRFSLSDDVELLKEVVSKDCPFRFNSPSGRCSWAWKKFNA